MNLLETVILAIIQGFAEFLPISSKGHLAVAEALMHVPNALDVTIILHMGTLMSLLVYYRHELWRALTVDRRVIPVLIVATLPAVVVGFPIHKYCPWILEDALLAGLMFPVTAVLLIWASRQPDGTGEYPRLSYGRALIVGAFQAVAAALPGISRSGTSIAGALVVGLRREQAATFAFLMAVPAIGGAGVLEAKHLLTHHTPAATASASQADDFARSSDSQKAGDFSLRRLLRHDRQFVGSSASQKSGDPAEIQTPTSRLLIGVALSFVFGLVGLHFLIPIIVRGKLHYFAWWLIPFGIVVTLWQLSVRWG